MKWLKTFGRFWYDFVVGDDWRLAIGAVVAISLAYAGTHNDMNVWWLLPLAVAAMLSVSLLHATRGSSS